MSLPDLSGLRLDGPRTLDEPEQTGPSGAIQKARNAVRSQLIRAGIDSTGYAALKAAIRANIKRLAENSYDSGCELASKANSMAFHYKDERETPLSEAEQREFDTLQAERRERVRLIRGALAKLADAPFIVQETTGVPAAHLGHRLDASAAVGLASKYFESKQLYQDALKEGMTASKAEDTAANHIVNNTDALIRNAVETAFHFFPDDGSVQRLGIEVRLMNVDRENYKPGGANENLHMDDVIGSVGTTYGLTNADRDIYFIITSFCADKSTNVSPRECGTVLLEGVPVIHPRSIGAAARALHENPHFDTLCTKRELFAALGQLCQQATDAALSQYTEDDLQSMGVRKRSVPMLDWTYLNSMTYHRSPRRDEVLETARTQHGMRGFIAIFNKRPNPDFGGQPNERAVQKTTTRGHPLTVTVEIIINEDGDWTMGEDQM